MSPISFAKTALAGLAAAAVLFGAAGTASALNVTLRADSFTKKIDGRTITFWGFDKKVPGPTLRLPPGDTTLNVTIENRLPVPVSLIIPALPKPLNPQKVIDADGRERVVSFDVTVPAYTGGTTPSAVYRWTNVRPGSYLYHSGYDPSVQVQMGLYGAVLARTATGTAYPGVTYDNEGVLIYGEVDADLHDAVAGGVYGTPAFPSTINYQPDYYTINGNVFPNGQAYLDHALIAREKLLIRLVNAGNKLISPTLAEGTFTVVAEDGNPYAYPPEQYGVQVPPGRSRDAAYIVPAGPRPFQITARASAERMATTESDEITIPLFDRAARSNDNTVNVGQTPEGSGGGGLCFLRTLFGER